MWKQLAYSCATAILLTAAVYTPANADTPWDQRYLRAACPVNAAGNPPWRHIDRIADKYPHRVIPEGTPTTPALRRAWRKEANVEAKAARDLRRYTWPAPVTRPIAKVAEAFEQDAKVARKRSRLTTFRSHGWGHPGAAYEQAERIREVLGLPEAIRGVGACPAGLY